jgi:hypothetical protein
MNTQRLIGFAGRKQSGKNTCADFIYSLYRKSGIDAKIYSLADPLKQDICIGLLGLTYDQCYGTDKEKNSLTNLKWADMPGYDNSWTKLSDYDQSGFMTARQVMQFIGTDIFRKIHKDIWINGLINKIKQENIPVAICCDIRFVNEVERFKDVGGLVIKLTRNPYNSDHSSETALDSTNYDQKNFDLIIDNQNISISDQNKIIYNYLLSKGPLTL